MHERENVLLMKTHKNEEIPIEEVEKVDVDFHEKFKKERENRKSKSQITTIRRKDRKKKGLALFSGSLSRRISGGPAAGWLFSKKREINL